MRARGVWLAIAGVALAWTSTAAAQPQPEQIGRPGNASQPSSAGAQPGYGPPAGQPGNGTPPPGGQPGYGPPPAGQPGYGPPGQGGYPPPGAQGGYPPPGAQGGYPPPGAQGGYPPPGYGAAIDEDVHFHDGFYMRLGLGAAFYKGTLEIDGSSDEPKVSGTGTAFEIALGGTPTPGFAIAGAITGASVSEPEIEIDGQSNDMTDTTAFLVNVGLLLDYYIDPEAGFHIQGLIGYGISSFQNDGTSSGDDDYNFPGPVGQLGLGYEGWVGEQWGIGVLGRLTVASGTEVDEDGMKLKVFVPAILLTATLH